MPDGPQTGDPLGSPERSDEELARLAQMDSGERARSAFGELVRRFEGSLYGFLCVRVGNASTAEELVQESFLRAWNKLHLYDSKRRFSTWLYSLAKNLAASGARVQRPGTLPDEVLLQVASGSDPYSEAAQSEELAGLWSLAREVLSEESRSALWLRYHDGLSNEEIGNILGRRTVSVRVLLFRAREALTRALGASKPLQRHPSAPALGTETQSI